MKERNQFFINVGGQLIPVTEEIYLAYYRAERRMRYFERDIKTGRAIRDGDGNVTGYKPAKEDSLDRLMEAGEDYAGNGEAVEDAAIRVLTKDSLREALRLLTAGERALIITLFFANGGAGMTEREYAKLTGVSQQSVNERKRRILGKLKKILDK
jgi:RNA polymerase sigma factor (sigma-70 family)